MNKDFQMSGGKQVDCVAIYEDETRFSVINLDEINSSQAQINPFSKFKQWCIDVFSITTSDENVTIYSIDSDMDTDNRDFRVASHNDFQLALNKRHNEVTVYFCVKTDIVYKILIDVSSVNGGEKPNWDLELIKSDVCWDELQSDITLTLENGEWNKIYALYDDHDHLIKTKYDFETLIIAHSQNKSFTIFVKVSSFFFCFVCFISLCFAVDKTTQDKHTPTNA